jgi:hypothetical protein
MADVNGSNPMVPLAAEIADRAREERAAMLERTRDDDRLPPAGQIAPHGGVARTEFFGRLRIPMQNGTGKRGGAS